MVTIRVAPDLPGLLADPARLELVLLNLVANAIKYRDAQKPEPFVEIVRARRTEDTLDPAGVATCTLCVRDNGLGIPEADQPAIFDRTSQKNSSFDRPVLSKRLILRQAQDERRVEGLRTSGVLKRPARDASMPFVWDVFVCVRPCVAFDVCFSQRRVSGHADDTSSRGRVFL